MVIIIIIFRSNFLKKTSELITTIRYKLIIMNDS